MCFGNKKYGELWLQRVLAILSTLNYMPSMEDVNPELYHPCDNHTIGLEISRSALN